MSAVFVNLTLNLNYDWEAQILTREDYFLLKPKPFFS